jgi:hypothetical protein
MDRRFTWCDARQSRALTRMEAATRGENLGMPWKEDGGMVRAQWRRAACFFFLGDRLCCAAGIEGRAYGRGNLGRGWGEQSDMER